MIRRGRHVPSQCLKQKHFPPVLVAIFNIPGERAYNIRHGRHVPSQCPKQRKSPPEILEMPTNTGGKCFCLGHWLGTWRP